MVKNIKWVVPVVTWCLLCTCGCVTSGEDLDLNERFYDMLMSSSLVKDMPASNNRERKELFIDGGAGMLESSGCYIHLWDDSYAQKKGIKTYSPEEMKVLLKEMQRVSKEISFPRALYVHGVSGNTTFKIGPYGRYIRGMQLLDTKK